jgi:hypothetical protein
MSDFKWPGADERQPQTAWQRRQSPPEESRAGELEAPPSLVVPADRVYVPYENRNRPEDLIVFCATKPALAGAYPHLENYSFDQFHGRFFTLFYRTVTVHVTGLGLLEIVYHIIPRKCAIVREWHRDVYDPPRRGIPVVESVTITPTGEEPL